MNINLLRERLDELLKLEKELAKETDPVDESSYLRKFSGYNKLLSVLPEVYSLKDVCDLLGSYREDLDESEKEKSRLEARVNILKSGLKKLATKVLEDEDPRAIEKVESEKRKRNLSYLSEICTPEAYRLVEDMLTKR